MENLLHSLNFDLTLTNSNDSFGKMKRTKSENLKISRKREDEKSLLVKNIMGRFANDDLDQSDEELLTLSRQKSLMKPGVLPKTLYEEEERNQSDLKMMKRSRSEMIFYKGLPKGKDRVLFPIQYII